MFHCRQDLIKVTHTNILIYTYIKVKVKVKVKFALEQATKAQRWSRGIALFFL
jgi:hypothetical protein